MAKKKLSINYNKCMLEVKEDNTIMVIETNKDGESFYFDLTKELRSLTNEASINISISFDNEIISE